MGNVKLRQNGSSKVKSDKQRKFVEEYPIDLSGKEAAIRAGYSKKSAQVMASRLLKMPHIKAALGKVLRLDLEETGLTRKRVLKELEYAVFRDPLDLCDDSGRIVIDDLRKIPMGMRHCIEGIKCKQKSNPDGSITQEVELKLFSKKAAVELAMRFLKLLNDTTEDTGQPKLDWDSLLQIEKGDDKVVDAKVEEVDDE